MADRNMFVRLMILVAAILLLAYPAASRPEYLKYFKDFPDEVKKCTLCHVQSSGYGGLNPFGRDFAKIRSLTPELMQLDSDSDRYSNIEELRAGTMPGDANSYPGKSTPDFTADLTVVGLLVAAGIITRKLK